MIPNLTIKYGLICLALSFPLLLAGQINLSGTWKGIITQDEGGYRSTYDFELVIKQDGNKITGRSFVKIDDIFATMELEGEFSGGVIFRFQETAIVDSKKFDGLEWCVKRGQLLFKQDKEGWKLEGFWQGVTEFTTCIPGKIFLKKANPRA
ncbi:MAG: hypothetical protein WA004_19150 [Saprospiraceae bacterium]